ncbi:hypothetical protein DIPPA_02922 [Diplonema papillatum]|nr:hypothetical protein DIPPA_02922 [Diplonema papillatum]
MFDGSRRFLMVVMGVSAVLLMGMGQPKPEKSRVGERMELKRSYDDLVRLLQAPSVGASDDVSGEGSDSSSDSADNAAVENGAKQAGNSADDDEAPPEAPVATISNDDPNLCRTWPDVRDGELVVEGGNGIWKPNSGCTIRKVQQIPGWQACLTEKNFAFIGDSLTYGLAKKLREDTPLKMHKTMFPQKKGGDCPVKFCGFYDQMDRLGDADNGHAFSFFHCSSAKNNGTLKHKWVLDEIAEADFVIYGGGMWDMGISFQGGPEPFFKESLRRLERLQGMMKPGAELIVYKLHHIHPEKVCGERELCNLCNDPKKSGAYRDALEVAAGCLGLRVLDTAPMTKSDTAAKFSHDGIHYNRLFTIAPDLLANAVCGGTPEVLSAPSKCQKEASLERWASIPEAHVGCKGIRDEKIAEMEKGKK